MKKPKIDYAKFEALFREAGLKCAFLANNTKVLGPEGHRVYVCGYGMVGQVDVSGFESTTPGLLKSDGLNGNVTQHLDFSLPENEVLENFRLLLDHMMALEPKAKTEKAPKAKSKPEVVGASEEVLRAREEAKAARKALIAKVAAEKGVEVSPSANV